MLKHRTIWLILALALTTAFAFAQVGTVHGSVHLLAQHGSPAIGATVILVGNSSGDSLTATTNGEGHFTFTDVPVGMHMAHAFLAGYQPANGTVVVMQNHEAELNFVLLPLAGGTGAVEGTVFLPGEGHLPAANATVLIRRMHMDSLVTTTNAEGHYAFAEVAAGEWSARAALEGYRAAEAMLFVINGHTTPLDLHLRPLDNTQGGAVEGVVLLSDGNPAAGARIELAGHEHHNYHALANLEGHFRVPNVHAGSYTLTAMLEMHGFASELIEVTNNATTHVTLTLSDSVGGGHHHGDSLTVVDLSGTAIVVRPDSIQHPHRIRYYLDVDADGQPDYRLSFGPPWYHPSNDAQRPNNGDAITVHGGLLTYTEPPVVVVYEINGLFWREPGHGHGGHGGGDHGHNGCTPDSVTRVELAGTAVVHTGGGYHGDAMMYGLSNDNDVMPEFRLDFGRADYDPGNGAARPADGDSIAIVGGQIFCPEAEMPVVIVYEINGMFWREPGDTLGLGPVDAAQSADPLPVSTPVSYLTARHYPNPFNPTTMIAYSLPVSGDVSIAIYDLTGRKVTDLLHSHQTSGAHAIEFDGSALPSGIYFYRITAGQFTFADRMLLLK